MVTVKCSPQGAVVIKDTITSQRSLAPYVWNTMKFLINSKKMAMGLLSIALVLPQWSVAGEYPSSTTISDPVVEQALEQKLNPIHGLQANFVQQQLALDGYLIRETTGNFIADKPGKIRWVTDAPFEQWVISDNETLWIYDPDLEQVTVREVNGDIGDSPAMLFTGNFSALTEKYLIMQADNGIDFLLIPIADNSAYQQIQLSFENDTPKIIEVLDSLGEKTVIELADTVLNPVVDAGQFHFEPPQDVDIIVNH